MKNGERKRFEVGCRGNYGASVEPIPLSAPYPGIPCGKWIEQSDAGLPYARWSLFHQESVYLAVERDAEKLCNRRHEKGHHWNPVLVIRADQGLMIPTAPGFVGRFQFLCVIGVALFEIGREEALGFSILAHVLQLLFVTALGFFLPMMKFPGFSLMKTVLIS